MVNANQRTWKQVVVVVVVREREDKRAGPVQQQGGLAPHFFRRQGTTQQQVVKLTDVIELEDIQTRISFPIAERPAFVCVCAERAGSGLFCVALLFAT
jgi:hypothetical protein